VEVMPIQKPITISLKTGVYECKNCFSSICDCLFNIYSILWKI